MCVHRKGIRPEALIKGTATVAERSTKKQGGRKAREHRAATWYAFTRCSFSTTWSGSDSSLYSVSRVTVCVASGACGRSDHLPSDGGFSSATFFSTCMC